jgi:hypothetical protein
MPLVDDRPSRGRIPGGCEVSDELRGLSPQVQEQLGARMAEVFAKAREGKEFDRARRVDGGHPCDIDVPDDKLA